MPPVDLTERYIWARAQLHQPLLLGYRLDKVNGQVPGSVFLLLRQAGSRLPNAEPEIRYSDEGDHYQVVFSVLPFQTNLPRPDRLRPRFETPQGVMNWIKTGRHQAPTKL